MSKVVVAPNQVQEWVLIDRIQCISDFLLKQNNFFSWKTSFHSLLWASSGLRENVLLATQEGQNCMGKCLYL